MFVKIFDENHEDDLENSINLFIEDKDVIDIRFSVSTSVSGEEQIYCFSALIMYDMNPKVTIITVCYNAVDLIENTLKSVLNQSYPNIEYIIIDGGSNDGTLEIIKRYESHIVKFISEPDKGIYDAMNKGIALSSGEWINFMNAGDVFVNDTVVENVFSHKIPQNVGLIYGNVLMNYLENEGIVKVLDNLKEGQVQFSLNHQSTFTNGDFLREVGYDISYKLAADANSFNEIYKRGLLFQYVPVTISCYEAVNGVSSKQLFQLHHEFSRIKGIGVSNLVWWRSYFKAVIMTVLMTFLPQSLYRKVMNKYVVKRVKH